MEVSDTRNCSKRHMTVLAAQPVLRFRVDGTSAVGSASPGSCSYDLDAGQWEADEDNQVRQTSCLHCVSAGRATATADSDQV